MGFHLSATKHCCEPVELTALHSPDNESPLFAAANRPVLMLLLSGATCFLFNVIMFNHFACSALSSFMIMKMIEVKRAC